MKRRQGVVLSLLVTISLLAAARAEAVGVLFARPMWSTQTYDMMWIKTVDVTIDITGQVATTHMDQTFFNEMNAQVEAVFVFPLPEGAVITGMVYWFNGQRYEADIRERQSAVNDYQDKIRQYLDPALLEYLGDNLFRLSIAPINAQSEVRFEISYIELLEYNFGRIEYLFLLNTTGLSPRPLQRVSLDLDAVSATPYRYFDSPTHAASTATEITEISDSHYKVTFGDENFLPDSDFRLEFETVRKGIDMNLLSYIPTEADSFGTDGFYALWITPPDNITEEETIPKNVVFAADVSSSMEGSRIEQLKEAMHNFLELLLTIDYFNIVTFGTTIVPYGQDLIPATPENLASAQEFVTQMRALGLTNIDEAMHTALDQGFADTTSNMVVLLTDGYPTWGETFVPTILENVRNANTDSARIFTFGVGDEVSKPLLASMASENGGYATYITSDDDIAMIVSNHFQRISKPVLSNLHINTGGFQTYEQYPITMPDLFWGSQVLQLGRFQNTGVFDITLEGDVRGEQFSLSSNVEIADSLGGYRFVPRLWAKSKIDHLLTLIDIYGASDELVNAIIELSLRFQVLTPYTAFYSDPTTGANQPETSEALPEQFALHQNFPNPFNPETRIAFDLPGEQGSYHVVLRIYDLLGRLVKVLADEDMHPGRHTTLWDGTNQLGEPVAAGVYVCRIEVSGGSGVSFGATRKLLLVR